MTPSGAGAAEPPATGTEARGGRAVRIGASLALVLGLGLAARSLPWREALAALPQSQPGWLTLAVVLNLAALPLWATQWCLLTPTAQPVRWRRMVEIVALTWTAQNTLTAVGGGASAVVLLVLRGGVSCRAALSLYALDQLLAGIAKLAVVGVAILLLPLPPWLSRGAGALLTLVAACVVALAAAAYAGKSLNRLPLWLPGRLVGLTQRVLAEALALEPFLRRAWGWPLVLAVAKKLVELGAVLAVQQACAIPVSLEAATLVVAAVSVATVIPSPLASIGVFEAAVLLVYGSWGVAPAIGLSAALLQHAALLLPALGCGSLILLLPPLRLRLSPAE